MAIIKYRVTSMGMTNTVFEEVTNPHKKGRILSKEEAERQIAKLSLKKVFFSEDGVIWDTEDEPLYEEFQGQGNKIKDI